MSTTDSKTPGHNDSDGDEDQIHSSGEESSDDAADGNSYEENSDDSLDGTLDKCPICLRIFRQQEIGTPDTCEHCYCLKCIVEWAENVTTCPIDRKNFHSILVLDKVRGQVVRVHELAPIAQQVHEEYDDFSDPTFCEICGCCDREDRLLLCDACDDGYHLECLDPPLHAVPDVDWWCNACAAARIQAQNDMENTAANLPRRSRSRMPRTGLSRRIMQRRRRDTDVNQSHQDTTECQPQITRRRSASTVTANGSRRAASRGRKRTIQPRSNSGRRTRRGRKKRTRKRRVAMERKPATPRGRLIQQLGILPPRPGQVYVGLPSCRPSHTPHLVERSSSAAAIRTQRHQAGIAPLRIYSTVNDLADYLSSDEEGGVGLVRIQPVRISDVRKRVLASAAAQPASSVNVLGPILSRQHILLQDKNMQISSGDGRLVPSISVDVEKLLHSPSPENDSSGYDSFGNKGSPPRIRRNGSNVIFTSALTTSGSTSNSRETSRSGPSESSNRSAQSSSSSSNNLQSSTGNFEFRGNTSSSCNPSRGGEQNSAYEELTGFDDIDKCAQRKKDNGNDSDKEDDEFNIYSDIEDDPRPISRRNTDSTIDAAPEAIPEGGAVGSVGESDEEDEMVIDEADHVLCEPERRINVEPVGQLASANFLGRQVYEDPLSENGSDSLPGDVEPDSPLSIPLPDSTPPPSVRGGPNVDDEDSVELSPDEAGKLDEREEQVKDEYDPCHPLDDSDEDEVPLPQTQPINISLTISPAKVRPTVETIPLPLPTTSSDDSRRPAIQFSIPSRHRIFSMGSLIRRNKGVMKKEAKGGNSISFQTEMSKAFASKNDTEDGSSGGAEAEKVSLVAEIFGSDEEEEDSTTPVESELHAPTAVLKSPEAEFEPLGSSEETVNREDGKWRKIVDDSTEPISTVHKEPTTAVSLRRIPPTVNLDDDDEVVVIDEAPPEVQIIETPPPELDDEPRPLPLVERAVDENEDDLPPTQVIMLEKTDAGDIENQKFSPSSAHAANSTYESDEDFERQKLREKRMSSKNEENKRGHKSGKKGKGNKRGRKRSRSLSAESNCEEGEILEIPDKKKRKSKKSKKTKKRRRSRSRASSSSDVVSFSEKKIPDEVYHGHVTDEDETREDVHWKKPSKSSKQRNYRDGKSKPEERYFRERENKLEDENTSRERELMKSPVAQRSPSQDTHRVRERSRSREHRSRRRRSRPRSTRAHSKHSNRSSSSIKHYRERLRSRSVHSRSSKPRQGRHHRDRTPSPTQWYASPARSLRSRSDRRSRSHHRSRSPVKRHQSRKRSRSPGEKRMRRRSRSGGRSRSGSNRGVRNFAAESTATNKKHRKSESDKKVEEASETNTIVSEPIVEKIVNPVEKEKRKKRKRREKSISPAKAIFADGDSIVVSLNFQKGKETVEKEKDSGPLEAKKSAESVDNKKSGRIRTNSKDRSKNKSIKKTVLIDLESSPIQEQNIGSSPTLIVLSDDEEHRANDSDPDRLAVSTTTAGENVGKSPSYRGPDAHAHGVPADSTQLQHHSNDDIKGKGSNEVGGRHPLLESDIGKSPARGDALVTSTRNSVDRNGATGEEYPVSPCTPPKEPSPNVISVSPPLPSGSPPVTSEFAHDDSTRQMCLHSPERQIQNSSSIQVGSTPMVPLLVSNVSPIAARPMGIGNIPGLFPSRFQNVQSGTICPGQMPVVIPTPPMPQLRMPPSNLFNQSVLATVANALYGPLLTPQSRLAMVQQTVAAQGNLNSSRMPIPGNVIGKKNNTGSSVLLPRDQNFSAPAQRRTEGGDSPFSPNSSDGDDLFEPPKDSTHHSSAPGAGHRNEKSGNAAESHGTDSGAGGGKGKGRPAGRIFDTLFGGPIKKSSSAPNAHSKGDKIKSSHKSKSRKGNSNKKAVNLSEGELRLTEEVPTSAVELRVKEKFLKKLNRQERVVEEVKVSLKPHYSKKHITKDEYKDILRRAVPKICHNKTGEINPIKIKELVEAYVKKIRKTKKK